MTEITLKSLISAFLFGQVLVASLKESEFPLASFRAEVHQYLEKEPKDPFSLIKEELEAGILSYDHEQPLGYLESLLEKLKISKYSQQLVFSTTSLQLSKISPEILEPSISTKTFTWDMFRAGKSRSSVSILKLEPSPLSFRRLMDRKKHGTPRPCVPEDV